VRVSPAGYSPAARAGRCRPPSSARSDGGYNYASEPTLGPRSANRVDKLSADRSVYVVGFPSRPLHFQMVFAVAREAGWIPAGVRFEATPRSAWSWARTATG